MGLFDRFVNPVWHAISGLDEPRRFELSALICLMGSSRRAVDGNLVGPFQQLCSSGELTDELQRRVPFGPSLRERLVDEALLACLVSTPGALVPPHVFRVLDPAMLPDALGNLCLAEINHRLKRSQPEILSKTVYSKDHREAGQQVLVVWAELLGIPKEPFVSSTRRNGSYAKLWRDVALALLGGQLIGLARSSPDLVYRRAKQDAANLSPMSQALFKYVVQGLS